MIIQWQRQDGRNLLNKSILVEKVFHTLLATMLAIALVVVKNFFSNTYLMKMMMGQWNF
jgi:hypothetical protein